jgi:hypothetical protein
MRPGEIGGLLRRASGDVVAVTPGPLPWPRMLRTGLSLGAAFSVLALAGKPAEAVLAALFANLLVFIDQAGPLKERLAVVATGAVVCAAAGALGATLSGHTTTIALVTLAFGMGAGLVHSWVPGLEMIPRQALICFIACAFLPLVDAGTAWASAFGAGCALTGALVDGLIRKRFDSPRFVDARKSATFPGSRFGAVYGLAVFAGLLVGDALGIARSYWVAITVLVVMQRGRRASVLRAIQRLLGTVIGVILAYVIVTLVDPTTERPEFVALILILPFLWPFGLTRNYGFGIMLLSIWVLLLIDLALPPWEAANDIFRARLTDTAIGCALAVIGTILASSKALRQPAPPPKDPATQGPGAP